MGKGRAVFDTVGTKVDNGAIVSAGLALLDRTGLGGCTRQAVAEELRIDRAEVEQHFPGHDEFLAALAQAMVAALQVSDVPQGWRRRLTLRAETSREAMLSHRDGPQLFAHVAARFPLAIGAPDAIAPLCDAGLELDEARVAAQAVDHFTMGWALVEQARAERSGPDGTFDQQLAMLLSGIAADQSSQSAAQHDERQSRFQSKLWAFLRNARESANISFARTAHVNELDRRILLLLHAQGGMTLANISMACGVDKAQVSRAIKRMGEVALLQRSGIRSPIRLSPSGKQLGDRLQRHAELRNRELTFGITDEELKTLSGVLDTLLGRAITLFEQERKQAASNQRQEPVEFQDLIDEGLPGENGVAVDRSRVLPPFVTLCSYMLRGGALAHKRQTSLSNFESWVMAEICRNPPISWPQLVIALSRDQSQAGRTVNHLIEIGLVERTGRPGRRHGFFGPTEKGRTVSQIIDETAVRRSEFLFQGIPAPQLDSFMSTFDALAHNAEVQLARERAILEMDRE
ncbi:MAG: TetR/AcrR family transcriptional regulator C-terminal domain-containing protein [Alphaproteobacteria bacterium]|nr:TetR/AcrR family transcriptional regulator C-terminal domain-containing protein [Alphaproteobacteria bacterium]MBU0794887.1 TetR/AcrR family transcriptional regulator C-terminal domain-containing protein [Alphaproteobacteria bacterium]MBU0875516.1 TetR/AcrR family transcriptional regulator C-terminal domain-containing protein [Alphaproteobacteria bacterium]MBU1771357.1 TetR/AcrR family transcriptional regulator C-terminal domain-containing protein [Alphaproteobacteria bacterium]